jgi:hypothetical protein
MLKVDDEVDSLKFRWCGGEAEPNAEVNHWNDPAAKVQQAGNSRSS